MWVWRKRLGKYVDSKHPNNMKLDNSKVQWIIREKSKGIKSNAEIAESMGIYCYSSIGNIQIQKDD